MPAFLWQIRKGLSEARDVLWPLHLGNGGFGIKPLWQMWLYSDLGSFDLGKAVVRIHPYIPLLLAVLVSICSFLLSTPCLCLR